MKKLVIFLLIFLAFFLPSIAQNWQPVLSGKTQYFIGPEPNTADSIIWGFKTTFSDTVGQDLVYQFNRITRNKNPFMPPYDVICGQDTFTNYDYNDLYFILDRENVGGNGFIAKPNGEYWFTGPENASYIFKTQAPIGVKWEFNPATSDSASILSKSVTTIYGVTDSVIEIATDGGAQFRLSKNHGFLQWPFFYPLYKRTGAVELAGGELYRIAENGFGRPIPGYADFYNFSPGDRFRSLSSSQQFFSNYQRSVDLWEITGMISSNPLIRYAGRRKSLIYDYNTGNNNYNENLNDTYTCPEWQGFGLLPGELPIQYANRSEQVFLQYYKINSQFNGRITAHYANPMVVDTCRKTGSYVQSMGWHGSLIMGEGIGVVYWDYAQYSMGGFAEGETIKLICYAKANDAWYGPCDTVVPYVGIDPQADLPAFSMYPNPANQSFTLDFDTETTEAYFLTLTDLRGAVLVEQEIHDQSVSLAVNHLPNGLYLVAVRNKSGAGVVKKLNIQH